jgi:hypothetical protein
LKWLKSVVLSTVVVPSRLGIAKSHAVPPVDVGTFVSPFLRYYAGTVVGHFGTKRPPLRACSAQRPLFVSVQVKP